MVEEEEYEDQSLCKAMNEVDAGRGRATPEVVAGRVKEEGSFKQDLRAHITAGARHSAHSAGLRWATYESESDTILSLSLTPRLRPSSWGGARRGGPGDG